MVSDYKGSIKTLETAYNILKQSGRSESTLAARILVNIASAYYSMEQSDLANDYYWKAAKLSPNLALEFKYLSSKPKENENE
jgi:tetratricopeptide (TPR) repeat protein